MSDEKKIYVTDGQDLVEKAEELKNQGFEGVRIDVGSMNYSRYSKTHDGKELQPVVDGINAAVTAGLKVRLDVSIYEGVNEQEILDYLQLTLLHNYDIVFMPTMDYDLIKAKMPGLVRVEGDFGEVEMYKYRIGKGKLGFLKN